MNLLDFFPEKSNNNRACANSCPVRAIQPEGNKDSLTLVHERCIGCGVCLSGCNQGMVTVHDSTEEALLMLSSGETVAALVDPSISAEFPDIRDYRKFVEMIRAIGFRYVIESAFGVDLISHKYKTLFQESKGKYYISANCPVMVSYVLKYHPELSDNLVPLVPPSIATTMVCRQIYGNNLKIIYITPCIAAKSEVLEFTGIAKIDGVLTFKELRAVFEKKEILESTFEYSDFDAPYGKLGSLYPIANGFLQAAGISEDLNTGNVITVCGPGKAIQAINEFETDIEKVKKHLNIYFDDGCMMGPGMTGTGNPIRRYSDVVNYARKRINTINLTEWVENMETYSSLDFSRRFEKDDQRLPEPSEENLSLTLEKLGKIKTVKTTDCTKCGFKNCRDLARAVTQGIARLDHCYEYALNNQAEYMKTLRITSENLARSNESLKENEKQLRFENENISMRTDLFTGTIQKVPVGIVIADELMKVIYSNEKFIEMAGEDALLIADVIPGLIGADLKSLVPPSFYRLFSSALNSEEESVSRDLAIDDKLYNVNVFRFEKKQIVGGIIKDMSAPEVLAEQVTERLTEVIDQNLNMVQQIGFLLGEGASKTEAMLNRIISSYQSRKSG